MPTVRNQDLSATIEVDDGVRAILEDERTGFRLADGPYRYGVTVREGDKSITYDRVRDPVVEQTGEGALEVRGDFADLTATHRVSVAGGGYEETITLANETDESVSLADVACGLTRTLTPSVGERDPSLSADRFVGVPFRHRADDPADHDEEYTVDDLVAGGSREYRVGDPGAFAFGGVPTGRREAEAWVWDRPDRAYLIAKYNDDFIERSVLEPMSTATWFDFGSAERRRRAGTRSGRTNSNPERSASSG